MISFDSLRLDPGTLLLLSKVDIDFVFQPAFDLSTGSIVAYKSVIRPDTPSAKTIVDEYEVNTKLHTLELATLFGSVMQFCKRGYTEYLCIDSFSSEILTPQEEQLLFNKIAKDIKGKLVFDLLDHNYYSPLTWQIKRNQFRSNDASIVLTDFSPHYDHIGAFNIFEPDYVKLGKCYLENVFTSSRHQERFRRTVDYYRELGTRVIIEGIDTKEEYDFVRQYNIEFAIGNYLGVAK